MTPLPRLRSDHKASERGREVRGSALMFRRSKSAARPPPPPLGERAMLLITKGPMRNNRDYPTMSMIIGGLFTNLCLAAFYFQQDSLWKIFKIASTTGRTHDVYDQKGFSLKMRTAWPIFSIGYRRHNEARLAWFRRRPHDLDGGKALSGKSAFSYQSACY